MNKLDEIITEISDKKIFGRVKHMVVTSDAYIEISNDFEYEFGTEYFDLGRRPNKYDIEEYFKLKIMIDDKEIRLQGDKKYLLLTADRASS